MSTGFVRAPGGLGEFLIYERILKGNKDMTAKKRNVIICVAVVLVLAIIAAILLFVRGGTGTEVFVQKVEDVNSLNLGSVNRYSGLIETPPKTKVNFDSSKRLGELKVKEGDKVKKGQVLFTYDPESINIEIEQGELEIERLNTNISNSNAQIQELTKDKRKASAEEALGINAQIQELQADISQSEYDIKTKRTEVNKLKASLEHLSVKSPTKGRIDSIGEVDELEIDDDEGGLSSDEGSDAFITIVASGHYRFKGRVSEQSVAELTEGTNVLLRSRIDETQYWKGKVLSVNMDNAGDEENSEEEEYYGEQGGNNSATFYDFYVSLESSKGLLLGQHVTCEIDYGQMEAKEGIGLSSGWFVQDEDGNLYLWVASKAGGSLEKRKIVAADYNEELDMYTIEEGLEDDEYIAWPGPDCVEGAKTTTKKAVKEEQGEAGDPDAMEGEDMEGKGMEDLEGEGESMEGMEDSEEEGESLEGMGSLEGGGGSFEELEGGDAESTDDEEESEDGGDN